MQSCCQTLCEPLRSFRLAAIHQQVVPCLNIQLPPVHVSMTVGGICPSFSLVFQNKTKDKKNIFFNICFLIKLCDFKLKKFPTRLMWDFFCVCLFVFVAGITKMNIVVLYRQGKRVTQWLENMTDKSGVIFQVSVLQSGHFILFVLFLIHHCCFRLTSPSRSQPCLNLKNPNWTIAHYVNFSNWVQNWGIGKTIFFFLFFLGGIYSFFFFYYFVFN